MFSSSHVRCWAALPWFLLIGLLLTLGPASADSSAQYQLGPGDRIVVTVFGHEDLSGEFELDGQGRIALPLIGEVPLARQTLRQAEQLVVGSLRPDYLVNPRVSIQVINYRPFYILGEVNRPGSYPYVNGLTVVQAAAIAGGYTYRARESEVNVQRAGDPKGSRRPAGPTTIILPGDVINVPQRFF